MRRIEHDEGATSSIYSLVARLHLEIPAIGRRHLPLAPVYSPAPHVAVCCKATGLEHGSWSRMETDKRSPHRPVVNGASCIVVNPPKSRYHSVNSPTEIIILSTSYSSQSLLIPWLPQSPLFASIKPAHPPSLDLRSCKGSFALPLEMLEGEEAASRL